MDVKLNKLLKVFLVGILISTLFQGCALSPGLKKINLKSLNEYVLKKMSFHPYVYYQPDIIPSKNCEILLGDLSVYEKIVSEHYNYNQAKVPKTRIKLKNILVDIFKKENETLDQKIAEIDKIRAITKRYDTWHPSYEKNVELIGEKLSIDEIHLLKNKIKKASKKSIYF